MSFQYQGVIPAVFFSVSITNILSALLSPGKFVLPLCSEAVWALFLLVGVQAGQTLVILRVQGGLNGNAPL